LDSSSALHKPGIDPSHPGDTAVVIQSELDAPARTHAEAEKVRVAWLLPSLARGYYWQPLFREFTELLPDNVVLTGFWPGLLPGLEGKFQFKCLRGSKFIRLKRSANGAEVGFTLAWPSVLIELFRRRPVVVFVLGFNLWTLYALLFKALTGCRVVLLWDGIAESITFVKSPLRLRMRRWMARDLDAAISNTKAGLDYLQNVLAMAAEKLVHQPYQVPDQGYLVSCDAHARKVQLPTKRPLFLCVGSIIKRKGWRYMLQAAGCLLKKGITSFSLVFVGEGEESANLRRMVTELGLTDFVHLAGAVDYQDLSAYFGGSDVFVLPTLEDVWAVVVLEAMALGKPILCSQYAGARELVAHGRNGYIFDPRNPQQLADYMAELIENPQLLSAMGRNSELAIAPFTPRRAAMTLANIVCSML
jgi:glycosyltransferase involved in cell wall biosynthesis